jgi:hypothetical protein
MYKQLVNPNLNPVVIQDGKPLLDWYGWCLATVECAFNTARTGRTAWDEWINFVKIKHQDRNFPVGVYFPIWFSGYGGAGHVAIAFLNATGHMSIWTSPWHHKPYFDTYGSINALASGYGVTFVGWSEDLAGVQLVKEIDMITKQQEQVLSTMQTGSLPGKNYNYRFTGKPLTQANLDALLNFWKKQPRPSNQTADSLFNKIKTIFGK